MREIKFRVWHKQEGYMMHSARSVYTCLKDALNVSEGSGFSDCDTSAKQGRYEFMQYTGLKDKNGAEIYEGDIVHCVKARENREVFVPDGVAGFFIKGEGMEWPVNEIRAAAVEVVGNIHENPELLEVETTA